MDIEFSKEEISEIESKLGFIVFHWAKNMIRNIISQAEVNGIKKVYMNTTKTINAGGICDKKSEYFYGNLPHLLGFVKEDINLRGSVESLWSYDINAKKTNGKEINTDCVKNTKRKVKKDSYGLKELPDGFRGSFISVVGKRKSYEREDIEKVIGILSSSIKGDRLTKAPNDGAQFFYDWVSNTWENAQRFSSDVVEKVVLQKLTATVQDNIEESEALLKFWSLLLSQSQHFGNDTIGFALVSPIKEGVWVINEVQTDCVNAYHRVRRLDREKQEQSAATWETIRDQLTAQNRGNWVPYIEASGEFKDRLVGGHVPVPPLTHLPQDSEDIETWVKEEIRRGSNGGLGDSFPSWFDFTKDLELA